MFRPIESHMFQKVSQTVLVVLLEDGADGLRDVEVAMPFGVFVMTYVVRQAIVEYTHPYCAVDRQSLRLLSHKRHGECYL